MDVQHLARPGRAFPGASTYVVWLVPEGGAPAQNMGALSLNDDFKGHLRTQTPYKTFEVVITAEAAPNVISPSENAP